MTDYALWGNAPSGLPGASSDFGSPTSLGTHFKVTSSGLYLKGYRFYRVDSSQPASGVRFATWTTTGNGTGTVLSGSAVTSGSLTIGTAPNDVLLTTPVALTSGTSYVAVVGDAQHAPQTASYWNGPSGTGKDGIINGPLTGFSDQVGQQGTLPEPNGNQQGPFQQVTADPAGSYPASAFSSSNWWVSPIVTDTLTSDSGPPPLHVPPTTRHPLWRTPLGIISTVAHNNAQSAAPATSAAAGVAVVSSVAPQPTVVNGGGAAAPPAPVTVTAPAPVAAVTANAGAAAVSAKAGGITGAGSLMMTFSSIDGTTHVESWTCVSSINSGSVQTVRILRPQSPPAGYPHTFLYTLPVDSSPVVYGSGMDVCQTLGTNDTYNTTIIEPPGNVSFYANHPTDATLQVESFIAALVNWVAVNLNVTRAGFQIQGNEAHHLIGFSKSGEGGANMLFHSPVMYGKGAFWDTPWDTAAYDRFDPDSTAAYGTDANFQANYRLDSTHITAYAGPFQADPTRLWISNGVTFGADYTAIKPRLNTATYKYVDAGTLSDGSHHWASVWVGPAVAFLLAAPGDPIHPAQVTATPATPAVAVNAGVAVVGAVAPGATVTTSGSTNAPAGAAAVSALATAATAVETATTGVAAATAAALAAQAAIGATAGVGIVGVVATNATVNTSGSTNAPAGAAAVSALAPAASIAETVRAGVGIVGAVAPGATVSTFAGTNAPAGVATVSALAAAPALQLAGGAHPQPAVVGAVATGLAPLFQVARSTSSVTDPRDGTATVTARATSTPGVT